VRLRISLSLLAGFAAWLGAAAVPANAATAPADPKGPVGWDIYRHLDELPYLSKGVQTKSFSSFDRQQQNADYGNGLIPMSGGGCAIADHSGPGEIDSMWFTAADSTFQFSPQVFGTLTVTLDGKTIINSPLADVLNGNLGAPFAYPLVAGGTQSSGGGYIDVPMPFTKSMLVTTSNCPVPYDFWQVTYRQFADANGVSTFNPSDKALDVLTMLQQSGSADPKPAVSGSQDSTGTFSLAPGASATLASLSGSGEVTAVKLQVPQLAHPTALPITDDGRAFGAGGSSRFTTTIDPGNTGVRITRRYDSSIGHQIASVTANNVAVGQWSSGAATAAGAWADQTIHLPASATAGVSSLTIKNTFVSSDLDFNEFTYYVDEQVGGVWKRSDTIDVGPEHAQTESAHSYQVTSQTWSGVRTYSYPLPGPVTASGRAFGAGGSSTFTLAIAPANSGVRLTRRYDPAIGHQVANITVDGQTAGQWSSPAAVAGGVWAEQSVEIPAILTNGKSRITVTNSFVSSDLDFNEFTYTADTHVAGGLDTTDTLQVGDSAGEAAHSYAIAGQTWTGTRLYTYPRDDSALNGLRLRVTVDGTQAVDSPLSEFFGAAGGLADVRSLFSAVDTRPGGWLSSWWPMPYGSSATVALYNGSSQVITTGQYDLRSAADPQWASALSSGAAGYFRTQSGSGPTIPALDWTWLSATGHGKFVGVSTLMQGPTTRLFLEGNNRTYFDGLKSPQINGTGTEDFFHGGWYFIDGPFTNPLTGEASDETATGDCAASTDCTAAYRLMPADAVPFDSQITAGIQHGPTNNVAATYSSTAFWYGQADAIGQTTDTLVVGDTASESAHAYTSSNPGAITKLTADYEGNDGTPVELTKTTRATTASVSFNLAVASANSGVDLVRTSDQDKGYQIAEVYVNGTDAGQWKEPLGNTYHRWLDDTFQLAASLTAGKSSLAIKIVPLAGWSPWSAAEYRAASLVAPFAAPLAPPSNLSATAQADGSVLLTWTQSTSGTWFWVYVQDRTAGGAFVRSAYPGTSGTTFTSTFLTAGHTYAYYLTTIGANSTESPPSNIAVATAA
jgi:hypothetical protein